MGRRDSGGSNIVLIKAYTCQNIFGAISLLNYSTPQRQKKTKTTSKTVSPVNLLSWTPLSPHKAFQ